MDSYKSVPRGSDEGGRDIYMVGGSEVQEIQSHTCPGAGCS